MDNENLGDQSLMSYTILSAQYANPDETAAIVETAEVGFIAVSQKDTPDLWEDLMAWGTPSAGIAPTVRSFTRLSDVYERAADDAEAAAIESAIDALPALARNVIRTRGAVYHDEALYTELKDALSAALTSERVDEVAAASLR